MKRSWLLVALLVSVGVNIGILAVIGVTRWRAPRPPERLFERAGPPPVERLADRLELEGDARRDFLDAHQRFFSAFVESRRELMTTRHALRREVGSRTPDRARIDSLLERSAELTADLDRLFVLHVLKVRGILDGRQERIYLGMLERLRQGSERPPPGDRRGGRFGPPGR